MRWVDQSDDDLLRAARTGESKAFAELHSRLASPAYALACRVAGTQDLAADAVQDAFIELINGARGYRFGGRLRAYLLRMVANNVYTAHRAIRVRLAGWSGAEAPAPPEHEAVAGGQAEAAWQALRELSHAERVVVVLRACQELSWAEIADVLVEPETTVKSRYHRAIDKLRRKLHAWKESD